ncbi:hypothetical protein SPBR_09040 [Sporothrix brasiliensis 5110]|uniref:Uncharacterized protein n=1 Tax=Sporothrix brasiliensis 5110 TaxID=1398154 RepID=A0A0C2FH28_9PEZI|nr:uncharacterized protein SPBR_09040 [Sporothrix brasiliensis 5110]KIH90403.1 hypothetical protein SPBR_09040 [Sporothrix brasiliensis 5110]
MAASRSTSTVIVSAIITNIVTSFIASTTTVLTTSTNVETIYQTNTVVLNAKATVEATSTWTYTSHHPVTVTMTEFSTNSEPASQSTEAPALVTSDSDGSSTNKNLSGASIAGIAIGVTAFTAIFVAGLIYFVRRHLARAKERRAISEDYAFLGTGRSDFEGPTRSNSNSGKGPSIVMLNRHYSGPPPPSARRPSAQITTTQYADPMQNERGLPPIPWYSTTSKTSPPTSPISPTSGSFPFSSDLKQIVSQTSPASPTYARTSHMRSGSANTTITAGSSTIAGGNSTQTSVRSNSGKTVRFSDSGFSHQRASSSGSGAGTVIDSSSDVPMETSGNIPKVQVTPISPVTQVAPSKLPSVPAPCAYLSPDPPSPLLQPQLGPLRIVNGSIDDASDQDEPTPKNPPPAQ